MTPTQSTTGQGNGVASLSLTLNSVAAGHTLVLAVGYNDTANSAGALGTPTGWSVAIAPTAVLQSEDIGGAIFYKANVSAGNYTVTINSFGGGTTLFATASLTEWNFTSSPLDQTAGPGTSQGASTTSGSTPTTGTLAQAAETEICVVSIGSGRSSGTAGIVDPPSGFTSLAVNQDDTNANAAEICYRDAPSTAGQSCTWTWGSDASQHGSMQLIATFLQGASGSNTTITPRVA